MNPPFRLTYPTAMVLAAISRGFRYGFDVMDATGLPDGTVYPILRRLEGRGQLDARWEDHGLATQEGRPPRRYYELTDDGRESLQAALDRYPRLLSLLADEPARV